MHSLLILISGFFMLGSYVIMGDSTESEGMRWGVVAGGGLLIFGVYLWFAGESFLKERQQTREYYEAIFMAVGIALFVRTFIVEPFKIPSGSMIPTLLVGDYLFVNKMSYGHRIPFLKSRVFMGDGPQRGDIVVFEYPQNPAKDYIKRIVGLPGDHIVYNDKKLYINGQLISTDNAEQYTYMAERGRSVNAVKYTETLDGQQHNILLEPERYTGFLQVDQVVPPRHYFAVGDNRDNSNDSRFWGFVPEHRLLGRAFVLWGSWDHYEGSVRWDRIGNAIE
ncbi:MAG: signal peptidase I [Magnetococcales bacterium]|nr:signal peptidase I [Magnetococcales bacterium]